MLISFAVKMISSICFQRAILFFHHWGSLDLFLSRVAQIFASWGQNILKRTESSVFVRHLPRLSKSWTYAFRGNNSEWSHVSRKPHQQLIWPCLWEEVLENAKEDFSVLCTFNLEIVREMLHWILATDSLRLSAWQLTRNSRIPDFSQTPPSALPHHTCKKRVMLRRRLFWQKKFAEKVRKSRQKCVNRENR